MVYLDNAATTRPLEQVCAAMEKMNSRLYGNPSSLHMAGVEGERQVKWAREQVANALGAGSEEIYFGGSGTMCNNVALLGAAGARKRMGNRIVISAIEHACVRESAKALEQDGFEVVEVLPTEENFRQAINEQTILVSCMMVNNETGQILPVDTLKSIITQNAAPAVLHIDAVQALGKVDISVRKLGCDLLTVSGHKIHGPKGVGALYVKKGVRLTPILFGGGQEKGLFPGTHNTPAIVGMGEAVRLYLEQKQQRKTHLEELCRRFQEQVYCRDYLSLNRDEGRYAPHIVNVSFLGYVGENVLHFLEGEGVYVSVGAACSNNSGHGSILDKMNKDRKTVAGAIRVSFSHLNTEQDIEAFFQAADAAQRFLIKKYK